MKNGEFAPATEPTVSPPEVIPPEPPPPMPEPASFEEQEAIQQALEIVQQVQDVVAGANLPPGFQNPSALEP